MKTKITVIPADNIIIVDGEALQFEFEAPQNIHAIQWLNNSGHIEFKGKTPNGEANYEQDVVPYVALWEAEKERLHLASIPTLSEAKQAQYAELPTLILTMNDAGVLHDHADLNTIKFPTTLASMVAVMADVTTDTTSNAFDVYDIDDNIVELSRNQCLRLMRLVNQHHNKIKRASLLTRSYINSLTNVEEVQAVDIAAKMQEIFGTL